MTRYLLDFQVENLHSDDLLVQRLRLSADAIDTEGISAVAMTMIIENLDDQIVIKVFPEEGALSFHEALGREKAEEFYRQFINEFILSDQSEVIAEDEDEWE